MFIVSRNSKNFHSPASRDPCFFISTHAELHIRAKLISIWPQCHVYLYVVYEKFARWERSISIELVTASVEWISAGTSLCLCAAMSQQTSFRRHHNWRKEKKERKKNVDRERREEKERTRRVNLFNVNRWWRFKGWLFMSTTVFYCSVSLGIWNNKCKSIAKPHTNSGLQLNENHLGSESHFYWSDFYWNFICRGCLRPTTLSRLSPLPSSSRCDTSTVTCKVRPHLASQREPAKINHRKNRLLLMN